MVADGNSTTVAEDDDYDFTIEDLDLSGEGSGDGAADKPTASAYTEGTSWSLLLAVAIMQYLRE